MDKTNVILAVVAFIFLIIVIHMMVKSCKTESFSATLSPPLLQTVKEKGKIGEYVYDFPYPLFYYPLTNKYP